MTEENIPSIEDVLVSIRSEMKRLGVRQQDIAMHAGVKTSYISRIVRGEAHMSTRILVSFADILEIDPYKLASWQAMASVKCFLETGDPRPHGSKSEPNQRAESMLAAFRKPSLPELG